MERRKETAGRLILHFGAVDQALCCIYINGKKAARHTGGYLPFETDITALVRDGENELTVAVKDLSDTSYHARGKQRLERGGMFYTAQSGIWQTVWMEEVPENYITNIEAEPVFEKGTVRIRVSASENLQTVHPVKIQIRQAGLYTDGNDRTEALNTDPMADNVPLGNEPSADVQHFRYSR